MEPESPTGHLSSQERYDQAAHYASALEARWIDRFGELDEATQLVGSDVVATVRDEWCLNHEADDVETIFARTELLFELLVGGGPVDIPTIEAEWQARHPTPPTD
jgi:hypothetical protein